MKSKGVLVFCFEGLRRISGFRTLLVVYFFAQISISGLASFVVPFFSNKIFSLASSLNSILTYSLIWFLFALVSVLIDYNGNKYNLKTYYKIEESQFKTHISKVLNKSFSFLKRFSSEVVVSRLNEDSESISNIVLWFVGILAMGFSCFVVLLWSISLHPVVFLLLFGCCLLSVFSKELSANRVSLHRDLRIKIEHGLDELHSVVNYDPLFLKVCFLKKAFSKERLRLYESLYKEKRLESLWSWIGDSSMLIIDTFSKLMCIMILISERIMDISIVIPLFTLQSTFQNQLLSLMDNLFAIRCNSLAVTRLSELEGGDDYNLEVNDVGIDKNVVLHANNVSVETSEGVVILDGVSLDVKKGEKVSIIGENGSGKTTLIRALMGLIPLKSGRVMISGSFGYSPVFSQFYEMSLEGNCALVKHKNYCFEEMFSSSLMLFPIQESIAASRNVCELSFGQMQQASLFRSQINKPSLLILDEPTHSLNPELANIVMDYFLRLPCAVVFITHDRDLANRADVKYMVRSGKVQVLDND